jgi:hypothetical protein
MDLLKSIHNLEASFVFCGVRIGYVLCGDPLNKA